MAERRHADPRGRVRRVLPVQILSTVILPRRSPTATSTTRASSGRAAPTRACRSPAERRHVRHRRRPSVLLPWLAGLLATGACFRAIVSAYLGESTGWRESLGYALRRCHSILWVTILVGVISVLGFLLCIVPGVYLYVCFAVAIPVLLTEGVKGTKALGRSRRLVSGTWWRVLAVVVLGAILVGIIGFAIAAVAAGSTTSGRARPPSLGRPRRSIADHLVELLTTPLTAAFDDVLYFDLRIRKEAFDLWLLAERLGVEPGAAVLRRPASGAPPRRAGSPRTTAPSRRSGRRRRAGSRAQRDAEWSLGRPGRGARSARRLLQSPPNAAPARCARSRGGGDAAALAQLRADRRRRRARPSISLRRSRRERPGARTPPRQRARRRAGCRRRHRPRRGRAVLAAAELPRQTAAAPAPRRARLARVTGSPGRSPGSPSTSPAGACGSGRSSALSSWRVAASSRSASSLPRRRRRRARRRAPWRTAIGSGELEAAAPTRPKGAATSARAAAALPRGADPARARSRDPAARVAHGPARCACSARASSTGSRAPRRGRLRRPAGVARRRRHARAAGRESLPGARRSWRRSRPDRPRRDPGRPERGLPGGRLAASPAGRVVGRTRRARRPRAFAELLERVVTPCAPAQAPRERRARVPPARRSCSRPQRVGGGRAGLRDFVERGGRLLAAGPAFALARDLVEPLRSGAAGRRGSGSPPLAPWPELSRGCHRIVGAAGSWRGRRAALPRLGGRGRLAHVARSGCRRGVPARRSRRRSRTAPRLRRQRAPRARARRPDAPGRLPRALPRLRRRVRSGGDPERLAGCAGRHALAALRVHARARAPAWARPSRAARASPPRRAYVESLGTCSRARAARPRPSRRCAPGAARDVGPSWAPRPEERRELEAADRCSARPALARRSSEGSGGR